MKKAIQQIPMPQTPPSKSFHMQPQKDARITQSTIGDYTLLPGQENKSLEGLNTYSKNFKRNPVTNQIGYLPNEV